MKILLLIITSAFIFSSALASDTPKPLTSGRFLLITNGDFYIPPTIVKISKMDNGNLKIISEDNPKLSTEIINDGGSYVFQFVIPGKQGVPQSGQDWPKNYYMTYAGSVSELPLTGLQGVCSTTFTYHHEGSAAQSQTGSFTLYSTEKTEQDAAANP